MAGGCVNYVVMVGCVGSVGRIWAAARRVIIVEHVRSIDCHRPAPRRRAKRVVGVNRNKIKRLVDMASVVWPR